MEECQEYESNIGSPEQEKVCFEIGRDNLQTDGKLWQATNLMRSSGKAVPARLRPRNDVLWPERLLVTWLMQGFCRTASSPQHCTATTNVFELSPRPFIMQEQWRLTDIFSCNWIAIRGSLKQHAKRATGSRGLVLLRVAAVPKPPVFAC